MRFVLLEDPPLHGLALAYRRGYDDGVVAILTLLLTLDLLDSAGRQQAEDLIACIQEHYE